MTTLTIFHDPECGLCRNFKRWLEAQSSYLSLRFLPYNSEQTKACFPLIEDLNAGEDLVVLADDGRWWQGPSAWLICLWALRRYREWSYRLAQPTLLPLVERLCHLLSANRLYLSHLLHLKPQRMQALVEELAPTTSCETTGCRRAMKRVVQQRSAAHHASHLQNVVEKLPQ